MRILYVKNTNCFTSSPREVPPGAGLLDTGSNLAGKSQARAVSIKAHAFLWHYMIIRSAMSSQLFKCSITICSIQTSLFGLGEI